MKAKPKMAPEKAGEHSRYSEEKTVHVDDGEEQEVKVCFSMKMSW